jgi:hypothetical protein
MTEYSTKDNNEIINDDLLLDVLREEDEDLEVFRSKNGLQ